MPTKIVVVVTLLLCTALCIRTYTYTSIVQVCTYIKKEGREQNGYIYIYCRNKYTYRHLPFFLILLSNKKINNNKNLDIKWEIGERSRVRGRGGSEKRE